MKTLSIVGHRVLRDRLRHAFEMNTLAQSYLFIGPEGVGKFAVAKEFARLIIHDTTFHDENEHPDICILEPPLEKVKGVVKQRSIQVETVREAIHWLSSFPYTASKKVLIIRDAHRLTEASQNALLKTLEEPPHFAVIILVTHIFAALVPTIVSRCRAVSFGLVAMEDMQLFLAQITVKTALPEESTVLMRTGRPGIVQDALSTGKESVKRRDCFNALRYVSQQPLRERLAVSEMCAKDTPSTLRVLSWWIGLLYAEALALSSRDRAQRMLDIEKVERLKNDLERYPSSCRILMDAFVLYW